MVQGEKIKNAIRGKGMKLEDAARILGITRQTLDNRLLRCDESFLREVKEKLDIDIGIQTSEDVVIDRLQQENAEYKKQLDQTKRELERVKNELIVALKKQLGTRKSKD